MRFAGLVAVVALLLLDCGAWPAGFRLEAELLDGRKVSGLIDARLLPLTLLVGAGETARIESRALGGSGVARQARRLSHPFDRFHCRGSRHRTAACGA
ncbi:MAG: hypothetical protein R2724_09585 [Bryobacterales bacterium]